MNPRMTRDELLRRGAGGVVFLSLPSLLAACGGGDEETGGGELNDVLNFSNWELYIDTPDTREAAGMAPNPTTLEQFTAETQIKVNYYEDIIGNPEYFATVQGRLSQGQGIGRDIIVVTDNDRYLNDYLSNDWALKLDKSLIPNISNLIDVQASPPFDPNREYTLPWFSGMDGIAWNEDITGPVTSVKQLLEDPDLNGKVGVWGQMGDTLGLIMLANGDDPAKVTDESFDRALTMLKTAVDSGQIRKFYGNDYAQPLATGDLAASMAWSGDIANLGDPKLKWVIPDDGGIIWTDNMLVPLGGSVPTTSTYMNFIYEPEIAAELALGANFISPVQGVREEAVKINPEAGENTLVFPTDEMLAQMHQNDPAMFSNQDYLDQWLKVKGT
jgi:spermidine/putrescine transport system substrate-binding protein